MKRRIISNFLCALLIMINVLNLPFGIVHAEEIEKIYDYYFLIKERSVNEARSVLFDMCA